MQASGGTKAHIQRGAQKQYSFAVRRHWRGVRRWRCAARQQRRDEKDCGGPMPAPPAADAHLADVSAQTAGVISTTSAVGTSCAGLEMT